MKKLKKDREEGKHEPHLVEETGVREWMSHLCAFLRLLEVTTNACEELLRVHRTI